MRRGRLDEKYKKGWKAAEKPKESLKKVLDSGYRVWYNTVPAGEAACTL